MAGLSTSGESISVDLHSPGTSPPFDKSVPLDKEPMVSIEDD